MIKKITVLSAVILMFSGVAAQAGNGLRMVEFGVKGGLNSQTAKYVRASKYENFGLSTDPKVGYHLGIISRINLPLFHIQPELLFTHTAYSLKAAPTAASGLTTKSKVKINTLEMPVMAGLRMLWFRLQAGPQFTLMTETKFKHGGNVTDVDVSKPTVSFLLGLGFDIGRLNLDVRYNGQFKRPTHSVQFHDRIEGIDYKTKMRKWMFSMGYVF